MNDSERIHPLRDVWLRPRRVFRELASSALGPANFALAALQGVCNYLLLFRLEPDPKLETPLLLSNALLYGAVTGLIVTACYAVLYALIGARIGRKLTRRSAFHVLSYGSVPVATALLVTAAGALLVGDAVLVPKEPAQLDAFVLIMARLQLTLVILLYLWSYLLQVMGLSELLAVPVRRAFGLWLLGQVLGGLAAILLNLLVQVFYQAATSGG